MLTGLKEQLLHPDLIAEYVRAYHKEFNRLAGSIRKERKKTQRNLAKVQKQIEQIVDAIANGMFHISMKDKMTSLEGEKAKLELELANSSDERPVLLHPSLADRYKQQVADLESALTDSTSSTEASNIIRSLLSEIRLVPENGKLAIELVGELAGLLSLGHPEKRKGRPEATCSTTVVAGAGFEPATFRL